MFHCYVSIPECTPQQIFLQLKGSLRKHSRPSMFLDKIDSTETASTSLTPSHWKISCPNGEAPLKINLMNQIIFGSLDQSSSVINMGCGQNLWFSKRRLEK